MLSKDQLLALQDTVAESLDDLKSRAFTPDMMLTFIARHPTNRECYVVVTSDPDLMAVAKLIVKVQGGTDPNDNERPKGKR